MNNNYFKPKFLVVPLEVHVPLVSNMPRRMIHSSVQSSIPCKEIIHKQHVLDRILQYSLLMSDNRILFQVQV